MSIDRYYIFDFLIRGFGLKSAPLVRVLGQQSIRLDDRLQHRVRDDDLVRAGGVGADLIRVEGDLQPGWRDVPTVKVLDLRPGAVLDPTHSVQLLQFLDGVV